MRRRFPLGVLGSASTLLGLCLALAAVFAYQLGLDSNPSWGPSRKLLAAAGIGLAILPWLDHFMEFFLNSEAFRRARNRIQPSVRATSSALGAMAGWAARSRPGRILVGLRQSLAAALASIFERTPGIGWLTGTPWRRAVSCFFILWMCGVLLLTWIATVGTLRSIPTTTSDYELLARGFLKGHLYLPLEPSTKFLSFEDPYSVEARAYMPPVWDISYFKGHFYIYWGPLPGLLAAGWRVATGKGLSDGALTLFFVVIALLFGLACMLQIRRELYGSTPLKALIPPAIALIGATPTLWLVSRPAVYEAAIAAGQAMFLAGVWLVLPVLTAGSTSKLRLAFGGLSLALSVGCRVNLLPASVFVAATVLVLSVFRSRNNPSPRWMSASSLVAPFVLVGLVLAGYNFARFGSVFEFGQRYQLGRVGGQVAAASEVSISNLIPNLYNYLFHGVDTLSVFPYLKPTWGAHYIWPLHYYASDVYYTEKVAGMLLVAPFLWVGLVAGARAVASLARETRGTFTLVRRAGFREHYWPLAFLALVGIMLILPILFFRTASLRYEFDAFPMLAIFSAVAYWELLGRIRTRGGSGLGLVIVVLLLALGTLLIGFLLSMTGFDSRFEHLNPDLFQNMTRWFTW